MNAVQLVGRLTKDIEVRYTQSGTAVGSFNLAVNRNFKNDQGEYEADFIQCVVWRKPATILAQYTQKGSRIGVEGWLQTRNYENQQGQRVYVTEVVVERFHFLEASNNQSEGAQGTYSVNSSQQNSNASGGVFGANSGQANRQSQNTSYQGDYTGEGAPF